MSFISKILVLLIQAPRVYYIWKDTYSGFLEKGSLNKRRDYYLGFTYVAKKIELIRNLKTGRKWKVEKKEQKKKENKKEKEERLIDKTHATSAPIAEN